MLEEMSAGGAGGAQGHPGAHRKRINMSFEGEHRRMRPIAVTRYDTCSPTAPALELSRALALAALAAVSSIAQAHRNDRYCTCAVSW